MGSYTQNVGMENPAYLSETNTWGTSLNTSRSIMDNAIAGRATFSLTTTSLAINITNGTVTPAGSRYWIFTGNPGGVCTIIFGPNTAQNWVFVSNQSGYNLIFQQGSGSTATVLAGAGNIVYFDGTGATANVSLFLPTPTQPPGTVTSPSYSFTGYPDIGLYVPAAHTMGIACLGAKMASFAASGAGPSGLNTLGATLGPYIGNAFSNLDLFSGGWAGPACPAGYSFLYCDEATGQVYLKYKDSTSTQRTLILGNYTPGNLANYAGGAPATVVNKDYYFQVNEAKTELDFYYKDSSGTSHGPIPIASYGPGNIALFTGSAPATVANYDSYFVVNEATSTINWYYQDSTGGSHGPIVIGTYSATAGWTTYTPTFSSSGATLLSAQGNYIQTGKSVSIQILMQIHSTSYPSTDQYTISLPVSAYTSGSYTQNLAATTSNPGILSNIYHAVLSGTSFTVNATTVGAGNPYIQFNGVYQAT